MRKTVLLLLFLCLFIEQSQGQTDSISGDTIKSINNTEELMPVFPGGEQGLMKYIQSNIKYPAEEREKKIEGTVKVTFVIDSTGKVTNLKVIKSVSLGLDKEAIRVVNGMPLWIPGKQNGRNVSVQYNLPVVFSIENTYRISTASPASKVLKQYVYFYNEGVSSMKEKKYEEAIDFFSKALIEKPKDIDSYYNRGVCYRALKMNRKACKEWEKAKSLGGESVNELLEKFCK